VKWEEAFAKHPDEASGKVDPISARARIAIEADGDGGEALLTLDIMLKPPGIAEKKIRGFMASAWVRDAAEAP
jgi:hypothetical protein